MTEPSALTARECSTSCPLLPSAAASFCQGLWGCQHRISTGLNCFTHGVSPVSGRKYPWLFPSSLLKFLPSLSLWDSQWTSDPSWVLETYFPLSFLPDIAIFQHLDSDSQWVSFAAAYHSAILMPPLHFLKELKLTITANLVHIWLVSR